MSDFEHCACPVCAEDAGEFYLRVADRFALAEGPAYDLQRCRICGMIYLNPRPAEAMSGRYYQHEAYLPFASLAARPTATQKLYDSLRQINLRWKRRLLSHFSSRGVLLDVGCGTGEFLAFMRASGWQVRGLERDPAAADWGRRNFQLDIATGSVQDLKTGSPCDVITLWHVLEHLYSPQAALLHLRDQLAENGVLIIAAPHIESLDARVYGRDWIALDVPRHVNHFTLPALRRLAEACGYHVRACRQLPLDAFFNVLMSEQLQARAIKSPPGLLPLRFVRAAAISAAALFAGSRIFPGRFRGATLVAVLRKTR